MKEAKKILRIAMRNVAKPENLSDIAERIEHLPAFERAHTVALFRSLPDEIDTTPMLDGWLGVKRLVLPVVEGREMVFREYTGPDCLCEGAYGICEPREGRTVPPPEIDLILVPGVAFDAAGGRLGRGKGFYDRYLSQPAAAHIYKLGLCLPHQLVAEVPSEAHDIRMDAVITAKEKRYDVATFDKQL